jgi:hypothetical protein
MPKSLRAIPLPFYIYFYARTPDNHLKKETDFIRFTDNP